MLSRWKILNKLFDQVTIKFKKFMEGRYGNDLLNSDLIIMYLLAFLIRIFTSGLLRTILFGAMWGILLFYLYRFFSTSIAARQEENRSYTELRNKVRSKLRFSELKDRDHRYFNCPNCDLRMRVPKGVGKITVECPKCHHEFSEDIK